jgi:hypothetical protein
VQEQYHREKEQHAHAITVYEKEIRKTRKEAFKSGSSLVKLQEELKATRNSLRITTSGLESEKTKASRREQEVFTAQYQLVGFQEELQKAQAEIKIIQEERDTLKTNLKEEEVARIAAEGMIALPAIDDDEDLYNSPRKSPTKTQHDDVEDKENVMPMKAVELRELQEELSMERRLRERAQDQIQFMKMECQFLMCSCRIAEKEGQRYVHDNSYADEMERIKKSAELIPLPESDSDDEMMEDAPTQQKTWSEEEKAAAIRFSPTTGTFTAVATTQADCCADLAEDVDGTVLNHGGRDTRSLTLQHEPPTLPESASADRDEEVFQTAPPSPTVTPSVLLNEPQTPVREIRTVTTTTTIPITFSPFPARPNPEDQPLTPMTVGHPPLAHPPGSPFPASAFKADGTLDREAALRQIRERRGRARSVQMGHATPRKQMMEGVTGRRDISAPALRPWTKS